MYQIELTTTSSKMFVSTPKYEIYGPGDNTLRYINLYNGITTIDLIAGNHVLVFDENGGESVNYVIGEIVCVHIADEFYEKESNRIFGMEVIARLGGDGDIYCRTSEKFLKKRPETYLRNL